MVKWLLSFITILCFNLQSYAQPFTSVSFSIQAHPDDWQLFMSSKIVADLNVSGRKMVFITLTAGDESSGAGSYGNGGPFYLGRENGAVYSSKFVADLTTSTAPTDVPAVSMVTINSHSVWKYTYKNTVNYFLRLPDGDLEGLGFGNNGGQSMYKLRNSTIAATPQITAINVIGNTTSPPSNGPAALTYTWTTLLATVRQIFTDEKVTGTQSWIHTAHQDLSYNVNDHSDHTHASLVAQAAIAVVPAMNWLGVNGFMDYQSSANGANLSQTDHENASALFSLEVFGMLESQYQNEFVSGHKGWLPMDLFQVIKTPSTVAPFAATGSGDIVSTSLTEVPTIVAVTSPVFTTSKDITVAVSPYEPGQLTTTIYDIAGNKVYELMTPVKNKEPLFITLKPEFKAKGVYVLKSILNNKFTDSRKIVVE